MTTAKRLLCAAWFWFLVCLATVFGQIPIIVISGSNIVDFGVLNTNFANLKFAIEGQWLYSGPVGTLSSTTTAIAGNYYAATNLAQVDTDLTAGNIRTNISVFGIAGTCPTGAVSSWPSVIPKTGQTISYAPNDDGALRPGIAWPSPRFSVMVNTNWAQDNLTGKVWYRHANAFGLRTWSNGLLDCASLNTGGITNSRMPTILELHSLSDCETVGPALPAGHPFDNVQSAVYYSSTTYYDWDVCAWYVNMEKGLVSYQEKANTGYVWPIRDSAQ